MTNLVVCAGGVKFNQFQQVVTLTYYELSKLLIAIHNETKAGWTEVLDQLDSGRRALSTLANYGADAIHRHEGKR